MHRTATSLLKSTPALQARTAAYRPRNVGTAFAPSHTPLLMGRHIVRPMAVTVVTNPKGRRLAPKGPTITLTETAAAHLRTLLQNRAAEGYKGIKIGVRTRGCNGMSYTMDYANEKPQFGDEVEDKGIRVFIDPKALMFVAGTIMDYVEDDIKSEFVFTNPNAKSKCGCGESFNV